MKSDCYVDTGIPVIRGTNISTVSEFVGEFVYISEEKATELGSANVYSGDLVFPHRGSIGLVAMVPRGCSHYVISSSLMKLTCNEKLALPEYILHYFRSHIGKQEILRFASTVGTPGIGQPLTSLKSMRLHLPDLPTQQKIASILVSFNDKIELNRKMNETLEGMARALFKSWFVDFDPVIDNAIEAGNRIPEQFAQRAQVRRQALSNGTANRQTAQQFPAAFQLSEELGWIPEGGK